MGDYLYKELSYAVIGAAMEVHKELGPGFPEAVYQAAMERELDLSEIPYTSQFHVVVEYKGAVVADYYLDLVVDDKIDVELKALSDLAPVHEAQVLAYLKASNLRLGLLFNFGQKSLQTRRIIL
jgi:GxxExxY protein